MGNELNLKCVHKILIQIIKLELYETTTFFLAQSNWWTFIYNDFDLTNCIFIYVFLLSPDLVVIERQKLYFQRLHQTCCVIECQTLPLNPGYKFQSSPPTST